MSHFEGKEPSRVGASRSDFRQRLIRAQRNYSLYRGKLPTSDADSFTALRSMGPRLAKLVNEKREIVDYDSARRFQMMPVDIGNLKSLLELLEALQHRPDCCLVHGAIVDGTNTNCARRLLRDNPQTGDKATLCDVPRRLLALDLDAVPCPDWLDPRDLEAVARFLRKQLPEAFHGVACIGAATSSHLLKPGLRFRLFFMLERALTGIEKRHWVQNSKLPIDVSIFAANQVIYTSAPIFANDADDPLPRGRLVMLDGARFVKPPSTDALRIPERRTFVTRPLNRAMTGGNDLLSFAVREIEQAQVGQRHAAIVRAVGIIALDILCGNLDEQIARERIVAAAVEAGKEEIEAEESFAWVLSRERAQHKSVPEKLYEKFSPDQIRKFTEMGAFEDDEQEAKQ